MTIEYREAFTSINKDVVKLLKDDVIKSGFFRAYDDTDKLILLGLFNKAAAELYGFEPPFIQLVSGKEGRREKKRVGSSAYYPASNIIFLHVNVSLSAYLIEFRHAMQWQIPEKVKLYKGNMKHDARGWALSLYNSAAPRSLENAIKKGLIVFVE